MKAPKIPKPKEPVTPTTEPSSPVVIEQTSKKWKAIQLLGGAGFILGVCILFTGFGSELLPLVISGYAFAAIGLLVYTYGRMGAWWHHG